MNVKAIIGALAGGVLGALLWAVIIWLTGYEVGYVAWAVGGLVGGGAYLLGGRGKQLGVLCAIIALVSILCGKVAGVSITSKGDIEDWLNEDAPELISKETYEDSMKNARDFNALQSEDEYPAFMVSHAYADNEMQAKKGLESFKSHTVPHLTSLQATQPSYEDWREQVIQDEQAFWEEEISQLSMWEKLKPTLGGVDALFFVLGVMTAFSLVAKRKEEAAEPADGDGYISPKPTPQKRPASSGATPVGRSVAQQQSSQPMQPSANIRSNNPQQKPSLGQKRQAPLGQGSAPVKPAGGVRLPQKRRPNP